MTFDPFGDFEIRGYLRNTAALHDPAAVRAYEHRAFLAKLDRAFANLAVIGRLPVRMR
jgi:cell filamentation protein